MLVGRLRLPGLLILLLVTVTACTSTETRSRQVQVIAVPSYTPPAGAPDFCALLAEGTDLPRLPTAMGTLAVSPQDVEARLQLSNAADELRGVLEELRNDEHVDVEHALADLATALETAYDGTMIGADDADVVRALDQFGDAVQPDCEFPA